jgi:hypothetical protein
LCHAASQDSAAQLLMLKELRRFGSLSRKRLRNANSTADGLGLPVLTTTKSRNDCAFKGLEKKM